MADLATARRLAWARWRRVGLMGVWLCWAWGAGLLQAQTVVRDDQGQTLSLARPPQRIVSLLPAMTEMVCELGACERLVGVDRHSNHPPRVRGLPRLGGMDDTPLEALIQLKPDLVLAAGSTRLLPRIRSLGFPVLVFEPRDQADTERMGLALARALGAGEAAWQAYQDREAQVWQLMALNMNPALRGQRLYIEVGEGPYVAAQTSFIGQALQRVQLQSALTGDWGVFPRLSPEWVLREQPDWVVLSSTAQPAAKRPGWMRLKAVSEQRVCVLSSAEMDTLVRPGPRLAAGIQAILACMSGPTPRP